MRLELERAGERAIMPRAAVQRAASSKWDGASAIRAALRTPIEAQR